MLILEGAGRLGKTTAAKRLLELSRQRGWDWAEYRKMNRPGVDFNFGDDYFPMVYANAIQDRFHLGGVVYHNFTETNFTDQKLQIIQGLIHSVGGMVVVFYSDDESWYRSQFEANRTEQKATPELDEPAIQLQANRVFRELADKWADRILRVNSALEFANDDTLNSWLDEWKERQDFVDGK